MASALNFSVLLLVLLVNLAKSEDLLVGNMLNATPGYTEAVKLSSIPLTKREKNVFYSDNMSRPIKAVQAIDLDKSKASPKITSGGVGSTFVNIKLKSEKGERLYYQVIIYV